MFLLLVLSALANPVYHLSGDPPAGMVSVSIVEDGGHTYRCETATFDPSQCTRHDTLVAAWSGTVGSRPPGQLVGPMGRGRG